MVQDPETGERPDVIAELKRLGRQLGETLDAAWGSAERKRAEEELKAGARAFAEEFEHALGRARGARPGDIPSKGAAHDGRRAPLDELGARGARGPVHAGG